MSCYSCGKDTLLEVDGARTVCTRCGTVLEENAIVSEITFGETGGGAAIVQGSYVGADQTRARAPVGYRNAGGRQESREQTMINGRRRIQALAIALHIPERLADAGQRYFNLAVNLNFVQGRRTQYVVAACLYCACRMDKTSHMLIDFSDMLEINVFVLGSTYLKLIKELQLQLPTVDPSLYITRFAALLEFGEETQKVAQDAVRLVARMGRDWMHIGRRPAGVCGACLLLAARMNNFRRSVAEVVQVVKIADTTLKKRLEEFRDTPSGALTVADFRTLWLDETADPPAFLMSLKKEKETRERERKRRETTELQEDQDGQEAFDELAKRIDEGGERDREREREKNGDGTGEEGEEEGDVDQRQEGRKSRSPSKAPAAAASDPAELMPPPAVPSSKALGKRRRLFDPDEEDEDGSDKEADEEEEGAEKGEQPNPLLEDNADLDEAIMSEMSSTLGSKTGVALTDELDKVEAKRLEAASAMTNLSHGGNRGGSDRLDDLDEDELDAFILTEEEVQAKSRLWIQMNKDYLQALADRQTGPDGEIKPAQARRVRKRNRPRDSATATGANAAEATKQLLTKKRFSKKINYAAVDALFERDDDDAASSVGGDDRRDDNDDDGILFGQRHGPAKTMRGITPTAYRKGTPILTPTPTFSSRRGTPASSRAGSVPVTPRQLDPEPDAEPEEEAVEEDANDWRKQLGATQGDDDDGFADEWA
ncbi:BQ2448_5034 [Microbotryum intermedium]|uniref:B-related factor 1 n=1 Tax=Microbotryum intermedium TaxID=269621 RepID=A0A238F633_9BASI|nr:BQ2448_5034 [Microbotryum intermedium]